ncbi:MAG: hypothetical protein FJ302_15845 [Planctomycetes bacterium]|nr:hypothetical protein [Planctomycetota bacterium]
MSISRRRFASAVAAATVGLPVALADEPKAPVEPPKPDPLRVEMAAWMESIRVRYPDPRMTPEVLTLIAGDVLGDIMQCRRISSFSLKNSDAPAFAMTVWRAPND